MTYRHGDCAAARISRRSLLGAAAAGTCLLAISRQAFGAVAEPVPAGAADARFPFFRSVPISYLNVKLTDAFWAPRQRTVCEVSVPWATRHLDRAGGLAAYRAAPDGYAALLEQDWKAPEFLESLTAVYGLQPSEDLKGLTRAWTRAMIATQEDDGYWPFGWPVSAAPAPRWVPIWWSHEDYSLGFYIDAAVWQARSAGKGPLFDSAVRAADNMAVALLPGKIAYAPGHPRVERALLHLYAFTGSPRYRALAGWLIGQRGHAAHRPSFGKWAQDHLPVEQQRTIEGHAVRAAYLFDGVTQYAGATGNEGYRQAALAVWDDLVKHKMYLHGGGGRKSVRGDSGFPMEGYSSQPDDLPPDDCYGESCSVVGNFRWAHNLFRLTGDARYIDTAERMLYNAFYASLSLEGDRYFYENPLEKNEPVLRFDWHSVPCCPPNIVTLFATLGGFFYSADTEGIYVKHYGSSVADIPFGKGVRLVQRSAYPWDGRVEIVLGLDRPWSFALRLRRPEWARSHVLRVNGGDAPATLEQGWLVLRRRWKAGDKVTLDVPMPVERITMPARFKDYKDRVALQRGPLVYCIEQQDAAQPIQLCHLPSGAAVIAEHDSGFLGGATVLKTDLTGPSGVPVPARFIPYGLWNNRGADQMRVWMRSKPRAKNWRKDEFPVNPPGS